MSINALSFGIFWVISDNEDLTDYELLFFNVPCDVYGNATETPGIPLNSKSGASYNHNAVWDRHIKNNRRHKPYNKNDYNYYPRGRVEISNNKAVIYLNPHINQQHILMDIKAAFGLGEDNILKIRVVADSSTHYNCFINSENQQNTKKGLTK